VVLLFRRPSDRIQRGVRKEERYNQAACPSYSFSGKPGAYHQRQSRWPLEPELGPAHGI